MIRAMTLGLAVALWSAPPSLMAQQFQGVIKQRTISLEDQALQDLIDVVLEASDQAALEELDEEAYTRAVARKLFDVPIDQVMAKARAGGEVLDASIHLKGSKMRGAIADPNSPFGYTIVDVGAGTVVMVSDSGRFYVRWSAEVAKKMMAEMGVEVPEERAAAGPETRPAVRDLARRATVGGTPCRGYEVQLEDQIVWGWVSDAQSDLLGAIKALSTKMSQVFGEADPVDIEEALWDKGFPMRMQRLYTGASVYEIEEVISIERGPVPDSLFEIPAGYTEKSLRDLWQGN